MREYPKKARKSYPTRWVITYGWRQMAAFTPRIWNYAAMVTLRIVPRHGGLFFGLWVGKADDSDWELRAGVGLVEIEVDLIEFWPRGQEWYPDPRNERVKS